MVIARLPWSIVDAKCHGASRWVVQCVVSRIHSIPQPSPSGRSSFFKPGKNLGRSRRGARCWSFSIFGQWPPGWAATSFASGTEMSSILRAMLPSLRHARACSGHPCLYCRIIQDVNGRDKPGHDDEERLMPAYWVARSKINDPVEYKKYTDLVPAIIAKFGGKVLDRGGHFQIMEGQDKFH